MTLFGVIWMISMFICFLKNDIKYIFFATLFFMNLQCVNVIYLDADTGVGPQVLTSVCFIIKTLLVTGFKFRRVQHDRAKKVSVSLIALFCIIIVSSLLNDSFNNRLLAIIQIGIYIICFLLMKQVIPSRISLQDLYNGIRYIIIFVVIIGIIQWFTTMFFPFSRILLKPLLYNDNSSNIYFNYNDIFHNRRIYSTFMEPSYLAGFTVAAFFYLLCFKNRWKDNFWLFILIGIVILLSFSSTAYGAFFITGLIFIITSKEIKTQWKIIIIALTILFAGIVYFQFYGLLDEVIFSKSSTGSGITRARWNREALMAYHTSQIYGIGYKNVRGSSIIYSILGELGVLGLVAFLAFNIFSFWRVIFRSFQSTKYSFGYYGVLYAIISTFCSLVIACPDFDLCSYWFWLYLVSCYIGLDLNSQLNKESQYK